MESNLQITEPPQFAFAPNALRGHQVTISVIIMIVALFIFIMFISGIVMDGSSPSQRNGLS